MSIPIKTAIATSIVFAAPFASAVTLFTEDFSVDNLTTGSRLTLNDAGSFAIDNNGDSPFSIANGVLTNPGTVTGSDGESGALSVIDIGAAVAGNSALIGASQITIMFDVSAGTGVDLFFHANGLFNGTTLAGGTQLHNFIAGGAIQSQFDGAPSNNQGDFTGFNLLDGSVTNGTASEALFSISGGTNGTITVSQTVDLASFGDPNVTSVDDLQFLTFGFATNILDDLDLTDTAVSIDNFSIHVAAVPEPSSALLLVSSASLLLLRRRR